MGADFDGLASEVSNRESSVAVVDSPRQAVGERGQVNFLCKLRMRSIVGGYRSGAGREPSGLPEEPTFRFDTPLAAAVAATMGDDARCTMHRHRVQGSRLCQRLGGHAELGKSGLRNECRDLQNSAVTGTEPFPSTGLNLSFSFLQVFDRLMFLTARPRAEPQDSA